MSRLLVLTMAGIVALPGAEAARAATAPAAFDATAYAANREAYAAQVVPGRAWQTAKARAGVPALGARSPRVLTVAPGGSAELTVQALPLAPVTFTALGGYGAFANAQPCITVIADAIGLATAIFTATPEVAAIVDLTAASPQSSGQVGFVVRISSKESK